MPSESQAREVLGVGADADAEEVRRAYRRLARRHHPDAGGDAAAFHELQQAVAVLLAPSARPRRRPATSPSRSGVQRPSTSSRVGATGWGESTTGPRWHEEPVDMQAVEWERSLPSPPHPWARDLVAVAAAEPVEEAVVSTVTGLSRRPGSRLNRFAGWLSGDLLSRWYIRPSTDRGIVGHDVEVRIELLSGKARRLAHEADWPLGWTRERRPSSTVVTLVLTPSRDQHATAVRAADALATGLDHLGWPLPDWYRIPEG